MTAITSYATLVTAIVDRMNDAAMETYVPGFVQLAEARFNRLLANLDMEGTATIAATATIAFPTDFKALRSIHLDDYGPLPQLSPDDFQARYASDANLSLPEHYAIFGGVIHLGPNPASGYTVTMTYLRTLTGLSSSNTTNWLLEQHPDLYLYGALLHAEARGWNDERLPRIEQAVDGIIAEINRYDSRRRRGDLQGTVAATYF